MQIEQNFLQSQKPEKVNPHFPRCSPHAAASDKNRLFKRNHENERKEEIPNPWANPNAGHFMVRPK